MRRTGAKEFDLRKARQDQVSDAEELSAHFTHTARTTRLHTGKILFCDRSRVGGEDDIDNFLALFASMKFGSDVQSECAVVQQHRCRLGVLSQHGLCNAFLGCQFANRAFSLLRT